MFNSDKLRGKIVEKFGSIKSFSEKWGRASSYTSMKLSGRVSLTYYDILDWAELLEIKPTEIGEYFFA